MVPVVGLNKTRIKGELQKKHLNIAVEKKKRRGQRDETEERKLKSREYFINQFFSIVYLLVLRTQTC